MPSNALKCLAPRPMAEVRLLAAPYAGAGASIYHPLAKILPDWIEPWAVQAPGREDRLSEPAIKTWSTFEAFLSDALANWSGPAVAVYGHSLGALTALAIARHIEMKNSELLVHAFFAARPAPASAAARQNISDPPQDDAALTSALDAQFGAPPNSFANDDIRAVAAPILRADLMLLQSFINKAHKHLNCPATAILGKDDPSMTHVDGECWQKETVGAFNVETVNAGHYFVSTHAEAVARTIVKALSAFAPRSSR